MTATPPTTAKSTLATTRSTNSFPNREKVSLDSNGGSWDMFFKEPPHVFDRSKLLHRSPPPANTFPNRLLHDGIFVVHDVNLASFLKSRQRGGFGLESENSCRNES